MVDPTQSDMGWWHGVRIWKEACAWFPDEQYVREFLAKKNLPGWVRRGDPRKREENKYSRSSVKGRHCARDDLSVSVPQDKPVL